MNRFYRILKIYVFTFILYSLCFLCKLAYANSIDINVSESRFVFSYDNSVKKDVFLLENPSRLVIDFQNVNKVIKQNIDYKYVKDIRASKNNNTSRLVFDINIVPNNFTVTKVYNLFDDKKHLIVDLNNSVIKSKNILIVIDPGHGGQDPGAVRGNIKEKVLNLRAAKILKNKLEKNGFEVVMTRNKDIYISLRNRVRIARRYEADLFISLHADATKNKNTNGTSIYSLSDKASDKLAKDLAESENKSDLIGGIDLENIEKDVSDILIDLSRRETKNSSIEFAELFVLTFEKNDIKLLRRPHRQAGFAVLKAPDIPSVLIEMGFISNNSDLKKLSNNEYLKKLMHQVSLVVEKYFIDNPQ